MSLRNRLLGGVALAATLFAMQPGHAQTAAALNSQIQALQDQVRQLNKALQALQTQVGDTQQSETQTQQAVNQLKAAPPPSGSSLVTMANGRPTISSADGQNSISLTGRFHFDMGDYVGYSPASKYTSVRDLQGGENIRRGRIGVVGKVLGDWNYGLIYDFGGSNDNGPAVGATAASATGGIETAELTYNGFRPFAAELGIQDVPYTLDEATSSNDIMFMERSSSQVIAANLAAGDFRSNLGGHWNNDRLWMGAYFTGPTTGSSHANLGQQFGAVQRATFQVLQSDAYSLHIGGDAEELLTPQSIGGIRSISTFTDRPELRIDTTQLTTTGTIGTAANPVSGGDVYGFEAAGGFGSAFVQGEYFHYDVSRSGIGPAASSLSFDGGYVEASYTLTGEHRKYNPGAGAYSGIAPDHPFSLSAGGYGAFELAARYSEINLNDRFTPGVALTTTGGVAGGDQQVLTIGLNWYANTNIRFMLDYLHGEISKQNGVAGTVPLGQAIGAKFDALALRTQVAF